jgi:hypothetical protein
VAKRRFYSRLASVEVTTLGTGHYLCKVYNYHDSRACKYMRSGILSRLVGLGVEWFDFGLLCDL